MSLLLFDGFNQYGVADDVVTGDIWTWWDSLIDLVTNAFGSTGKSARVDYSDNYQFGISTLNTDSDTFILGYKVYLYNYQTSAGRIFIQGSGYNLVWAQLVNSTGLMGFYNGDDQLLGTASIPFGVWVYVEIKCKFHPTAGTLEVRCNEQVLLDLTGLDTVDNSSPSPYTPTALHFTNSWQGGTVLYTDIYICDGNGSSHNDFLGVCTVSTLRPDGDSSVAWTKSAGSTNYENVDEVIPDEDTSYNYSATTAQQDLFTFEDLPASADVVYAVAIDVHARQESTASRSLTLHLNTGANVNEGVITAIPGIADYYVRGLALPYQTGTTAWTEAAVNAAIAGYEVT